jgi:hypothetical protein
MSAIMRGRPVSRRQAAAEILFDQYDRGGPIAPRQVLLTPELVVRAACP